MKESFFASRGMGARSAHRGKKLSFTSLRRPPHPLGLQDRKSGTVVRTDRRRYAQFDRDALVAILSAFEPGDLLGDCLQNQLMNAIAW